MRDLGLDTELTISEIFGPTFQGEGSSLGQHCAFVRLGGCNLHCSWCDTAYTWDWTGMTGRKYNPKEELHRVTVEEVVEGLGQTGSDMVVITGGEPLLQAKGVEVLASEMRCRGWRVEVETNGTIAPGRLAAVVDQFNVSPKLRNNRNDSPKLRTVKDALKAFEHTGKARFKFVVSRKEDLSEVDAIVKSCDLTYVYIMPEGRHASVLEERLKELAPAVLDRGWNITTRLHVAIWGDRRGH